MKKKFNWKEFFIGVIIALVFGCGLVVIKSLLEVRADKQTLFGVAGGMNAERPTDRSE